MQSDEPGGILAECVADEVSRRTCVARGEAGVHGRQLSASAAVSAARLCNGDTLRVSETDSKQIEKASLDLELAV